MGKRGSAGTQSRVETNLVCFKARQTDGDDLDFSQVLAPETAGTYGGVLVEGGDRFPEATPVVLQGSSAGGNLVRIGWIGVGLRMELSVGPRRIITSRVSSVTIEAAGRHGVA